jgi:hypothetical protein
MLTGAGSLCAQRAPRGRAAPKAALPRVVSAEVAAARLTDSKLEIAQARLRASDGSRALAMQRSIAGRLARPGRLPCAGTQVREVYPTTLLPGDPVLLLGCGFPAKPAVVMSVPASPSAFTAVQVTRSDATHIEAVVPTLSGFARAASVAFRVGPASLSAPVTLSPQLAIVGLDLNNPQTSFTMTSPLAPCRGSGHMPLINGQHFEFIHPTGSAGDCSGTDLFRTSRPLSPGWAYESTETWTRCLTRTSPATLEDCGSASQVVLPEGLQFSAGETVLPRIPFSWTCARDRTCAYGGTILVKGPKGTRPY